jgi:hypothetical protein
MQLITLNRQTLGDLCSSGIGVGWKQSQMEALGIKWPPRKGWIKKLTGKQISMDDFSRVRNLGHFQTEDIARMKATGWTIRKVKYIKALPQPLDYQI